jgi:hypothetical protein
VRPAILRSHSVSEVLAYMQYGRHGYMFGPRPLRNLIRAPSVSSKNYVL